MIYRKIFIITALIAGLVGCSKEGGPGGEPTDEREVQMDFQLPGTATMAAGEAENDIKNITLLVFDGEGDDAAYLYSRYAWRKSSGANTFTTTLKIGEGFTIYFAANAADPVEAAGFVENNTTWAEAREMLVMDNPAGIDPEGRGLPMWGMVKNQKIEDRPLNSLGTVQLVRSVASIDIYMLADNFTLEEAFVVFAADKGYLPYDPGKMDVIGGVLRANAPYSPQGFGTMVDLDYRVPTGTNEVIGKFYVYDNSTSLNPTGPNRPTKIMLKGVLQDGGVSSYYPLSIRNRTADGAFVKKQVTRNNKYTVMVRSVHGDGYGSLEEARDADDVNGDWDVIEWDDNEDGEIIIDGPKYFFRDRTSVTLPRKAGTSSRVNVRTNYTPGEIGMKFAGSTGDYTYGGVADDHPRFKVELVEGASAGSSYDCFRITAKKDFGADDNPAVLNVLAGRIGFSINIEQLDLSPDDWNDGGNVIVDLGTGKLE